MFGKKKKEETAEEIIEKMLPEERAQVRELIRNLTNELMEKSQTCRMLEKELKRAVKRKKPKHDPLLGHVAWVLFTRARFKNPDGKIRMFTADNVQANQAFQSIKAGMRDPDNDFIGGYFMLPMKGKSDALKRLNTNAEAAWHLFQCLDKDLKIYDPETSEKCPNCEGNPEGYKKEHETTCPSCKGHGRIQTIEQNEQPKDDKKGA